MEILGHLVQKIMHEHLAWFKIFMNICFLFVCDFWGHLCPNTTISPRGVEKIMSTVLGCSSKYVTNCILSTP